jgi:hypothetical protein
MWDGSAISLQRNLTIAAELLAMGAKDTHHSRGGDRRRRQ